MQPVTLFLTITFAVALVVTQTYKFCCRTRHTSFQCCGTGPCNVFCCNCDGQTCDRHCPYRKTVDINNSHRSARSVHYSDLHSRNAYLILKTDTPLAIFNSIDENQDHLIDFQEADFYYRNITKRSTRSVHETVTNDFRLNFNEIDLNKDGFIEVREFDLSLS